MNRLVGTAAYCSASAAAGTSCRRFISRRIRLAARLQLQPVVPAHYLQLLYVQTATKTRLGAHLLDRTPPGLALMLSCNLAERYTYAMHVPHLESACIGLLSQARWTRG
jgi:hypothetical protein